MCEREMARQSPTQGWEPGTECVGKYNFPGSASHVSHMMHMMSCD